MLVSFSIVFGVTLVRLHDFLILMDRIFYALDIIIGLSIFVHIIN